MFKFIRNLFAKAKYVEFITEENNRLGNEALKAKNDCQAEMIAGRQANSDLTETKRCYKNMVMENIRLKKELAAYGKTEAAQ